MVSQRSAYARVSKMFFDNRAVMRAVDNGTRRALSKFGAFVRSDAQKSLKQAGKNTPPSKAPAPPRSRTKKLKRGIMFSYERRTQNVVIGPVRFPRARGDNLIMLEYGGTRRQRMPDVPNAVRFGGKKIRRQRQRDARGRFVRKQNVAAPDQRGKFPMVKRVARYPARPFMDPPFQKHKKDLRKFFQDCVHKR